MSGADPCASLGRHSATRCESQCDPTCNRTCQRRLTVRAGTDRQLDAPANVQGGRAPPTTPSTHSGGRPVGAVGVHALRRTRDPTGDRTPGASNSPRTRATPRPGAARSRSRRGRREQQPALLGSASCSRPRAVARARCGRGARAGRVLLGSASCCSARGLLLAPGGGSEERAAPMMVGRKSYLSRFSGGRK